MAAGHLESHHRTKQRRQHGPGRHDGDHTCHGHRVDQQTRAQPAVSVVGQIKGRGVGGGGGCKQSTGREQSSRQVQTSDGKTPKRQETIVGCKDTAQNTYLMSVFVPKRASSSDDALAAWQSARWQPISNQFIHRTCACAWTTAGVHGAWAIVQGACGLAVNRPHSGVRAA